MELTAKEKAIELVNKYIQFNFSTLSVSGHLKLAKQCALIAVDELLMEIRRIYDIYTEENIICKYKFWEQVKQEINNL
jgi:hypothetical protein